MDEESSRLRALLEVLHGELSRLSQGDDEARQAGLLNLKTDIERVLARREEDPAVEPHERVQFQEHLQALAAGFEGAHPQLASALEQTMNALSNMGL